MKLQTIFHILNPFPSDAEGERMPPKLKVFVTPTIWVFGFGSLVQSFEGNLDLALGSVGIAILLLVASLFCVYPPQREQ